MLVCVVCITRPPQFTDSLMCGPCYGRLKRDIATLVGAHTWLGIAMCNPTPAFKPGTIHRAAGPSVPFRAELHDARAEIGNLFTTWARVIAEQHVPALAGPADRELVTVAKWLRARLPWAERQMWADDLANQFAGLGRYAYALVPWNVARRDLPLPCPGCGLLSLSVYGGTDSISCRIPDCGHRMTWANYEKAVREKLAQVTAPMIQEAAA